MSRGKVSTHGPGGLPRDGGTGRGRPTPDRRVSTHGPGGLPRDDKGQRRLYESMKKKFQLMAPGGCPETRFGRCRSERSGTRFNSWPRGVAPRPSMRRTTASSGVMFQLMAPGGCPETTRRPRPTCRTTSVVSTHGPGGLPRDSLCAWASRSSMRRTSFNSWPRGVAPRHGCSRWNVGTRRTGVSTHGPGGLPRDRDRRILLCGGDGLVSTHSPGGLPRDLCAGATCPRAEGWRFQLIAPGGCPETGPLRGGEGRGGRPGFNS